MTQDPVSLQSAPTERTPYAHSPRLAIWLFTLAVFSSAILLFVLEPLFAKIILPTFGGSPAVWITCMVFFQVVLLLGYFYSHLVTRQLTRTLVGLHIAGLALSCLALPIAVRAHVDVHTAVYHPSFSLLLIATASIGLPFFFLASTAPLLQRWFSHTTHPDAADPYFLYAASNAGSLVGLALYPAALEPRFSLTGQASGWSLGYLFLVALIASCGVLAYRQRQRTTTEEVAHTPPPTHAQEFLWLAFAFVPASLLYGVTAQLSTDFPPVPLLWVVPLAIYLLSFIIGFSTAFSRVRAPGRLLPTVILFSAALYVFGSIASSWVITGSFKLLCFGMIAVALHSELALRRPATDQLTRFYLFVSFGGVLAGVLNGLVAPLVFSDYWEYPITLVLAAMLLPAVSGATRRPLRPALVWFSFGIVFITMVASRIPALHAPPAVAVFGFVFSMLLCFRVPLRWTAIAVLMVLSFAKHIGRAGPDVLYKARSFYGVYRVTYDEDSNLHTLVHGTTLHGAQALDNPPVSAPASPIDGPSSRRPAAIPLDSSHYAGSTYYSPVGPIVANARERHPVRMGVVGLGAGTTACFAAPGESITFFEIDPLVEKIARDSRFFTYLSQCPGHSNVVLGDARLTLSQAAPQSFDVLVIDAFSSDAIPMHLLTTQAFDLYRRTLADGGILMIHVSNRYLDLQPVVQGSANYRGYQTMVLLDNPSPDQVALGRLKSKWMVIAPEDRVPALEAKGCELATGKSTVWTDDRSSLFSVVIWSKLLRLKQGAK